MATGGAWAAARWRSRRRAADLSGGDPRGWPSLDLSPSRPSPSCTVRGQAARRVNLVPSPRAGARPALVVNADVVAAASEVGYDCARRKRAARVFFVLSKSLDLFVAPLTWVALLVLAALWGSYRKRRTVAISALLAALAVLFVCSSASVANEIAWTLESSARTTMSPRETYDVVVVLGGLTDGEVTSPTGAPEFGEAVDRILAAYDVARGDRARYVLITSNTEEAHALAKQLADWGIAPDRIVVEERSRNTHGNAVESARIIRERAWSRVLLVTSALHMRRAEGCFRAAGVVLDTLPVDRQARDPSRMRWRLEPRADALNLTTSCLREAVGRVVYRAMGYSR